MSDGELSIHNENPVIESLRNSCALPGEVFRGNVEVAVGETIGDSLSYEDIVVKYNSQFGQGKWRLDSSIFGVGPGPDKAQRHNPESAARALGWVDSTTPLDRKMWALYIKYQ